MGCPAKSLTPNQTPQLQCCQAIGLVGSVSLWIVTASGPIIQAQTHEDFLGDDPPRVIEISRCDEFGSRQFINRQTGNFLAPGFVRSIAKLSLNQSGSPLGFSADQRRTRPKILVLLDQPNHILHRPKPRFDPRRHRWARPQRLVNADEVVEHEIERQRAAVVVDLCKIKRNIQILFRSAQRLAAAFLAISERRSADSFSRRAAPPLRPRD